MRSALLRAVPALAMAAVILSLTLTPSPGGSSIPRELCILCGGRGLADLTLNVLLFVPLGAALAFAGRDIRRTFWATLVLSACIEALQVVIPGRAPTYRDVIANGAGGAAGAWILLYGERWLAAPRLRVLRIAAAALFPALGVLGAGCLERPFASRVDYFGQWAADLGSYGVWRGEVNDVRIGDRPLPPGRLVTDDALRALVGSGALVRIEAVAGPAPTEVSPIFSLADERSEFLLVLAQEGADLVIRRFLVGSQLRLDTPELRFPAFFAETREGAAFTLTVEYARGVTCAALGERRRCIGPQPAGALWHFFFWLGGASVGLTRLLDALTIAALFVPLGLVGASQSWSRLALVATAAVAGAMLAAWNVHLQPLAATEILSGLGAVALTAYWLGRRLRLQGRGDRVEAERG